MSLRVLLFSIILSSDSAFALCIDTIPPVVDSVVISNTNQLLVHFSEPITNNTAVNINNYSLSNTGTQPTYASMVNNQTIRLAFADSFLMRQIYTINISGIADISNNTMPAAQSIRFYKYLPMPYDILISELMADPSPPVALPEVEWIELYNNSPFTIDLYGWRIGKSTGKSGPIPHFYLQPDSSLIICSTGSLAELQTLATSRSVTSFPTLSNLDDCIFLLSPVGQTIHTVNYTDEFYQNEVKKIGGWSLEMIDPKNPCSGKNNWIASNDSRGSTPATINSVHSNNPDRQPPEILWLSVPDSMHVLLHASEPIDSSDAANINHYLLSDNIGLPIIAKPLAPLFQDVLLEFTTPMTKGEIHQLTIRPVSDCVGQQAPASQLLAVAIPVIPDPGDVVVNEIMFNPKSGGVDYVEIINRSNKVFDMQKIFIANRNTSGTIDNIVKISGDNRMLFPGEMILLSEDTAITKRDYHPLNDITITQHDALPSFNDDEGFVILLRADGQLIDELHYDDNWHFELIDNTEGVSLERIDVYAPTQKKDNWHSAAESVGYGTPGYKNSQTVSNMVAEGSLSISPQLITPNNDGKDDFISIQYHFPEPGNMANIKLFDAGGRFIRWITSNFLCGTDGRLIWDGLGAEKRQLVPGPYLIYTETFNASGKVRKFKNLVYVAR